MRILLVLLLAPMAFLAQTPAPSKSQAVSSGPIARCKGPNGTPCTADQVKKLCDAVFAAKRQHDSLLPFKDLSLAASDGTLKCVLEDGSPCVTAQLDLVKEIGTGQQLYINYSRPKPSAAK